MMDMAWSAQKPGNWLFHCHVLFHTAPELRTSETIHDHSALGPEDHMAGLVLGVRAVASTDSARNEGTGSARALTLLVGERVKRTHRDPATGRDTPALGYALVEATEEPRETAPGPTLVLTRGEPVAITIMNRLRQATSVHWHGIELESYYDGVPGFGGLREVTPYIAPGQSFVARFTPPRSGTFIYHTHFNDYLQLSTGLYGALLVLDDRTRFDPEHDKVFVISRDGPDDEHDAVLVNGATEIGPAPLTVGESYRFRFIGITPAPDADVSMSQGGTLVEWRPMAKDGAELPLDAQQVSPAQVRIAPGETYDFEVRPAQRGELRVRVYLRDFNKEAVVRFDVR
jgi:FtsP/CotA-like multicopper oxidase with cupredoxin domain